MMTITPDLTKKMTDEQILSCLRERDFQYEGKTVVCVGKVKEISMFLGERATEEGLKPIREDLKKELFGRHPEWSEETQNQIVDGIVKMGMSKDDVVLRWGKPQDINRTVTRNSVGEQWVYGYGSNTKYLYFENNSLKSWQD